MNLGLLILRLVVGVLFMGHGAQKLFGSFGGAGIDGTAAFFEQAGLRPGRLHAWSAGLAEFGGGLLLALGLLSPFAAAALIGVMTAAIITVHVKNGVWATAQGYEYNLVLIAVAVAVSGVGAGAWSLDNALNLDLAGTGWAVGALVAGVLGGVAAVLSGRMQGAAEQSPPAQSPPPAPEVPSA
ncbi:MAG TPA: DoxX family protein [Solirubrobacterales bacterium]|nr:DoxX family protein [Solirubrobacterales bacterium]